MGELRDQMETDLRLRRYNKGTRNEYLRCMTKFGRFFICSPDQMGEEEVRAFLVHLVEEPKVAASTQKL